MARSFLGSASTRRTGVTLSLLILLVTSVCVTTSNGLEFTDAERNGDYYEYNVDINQNDLAHQTILELHCNDTQNPNTVISYSILPPSVRNFTINPSSGEVKLTVDTLTLEDGREYSVQIECFSSSDGSSEQATLRVHYHIENEFPPVFIRTTQLRLTIDENNNITGESGVIYVFHATDSDRGTCGEISYSVGSSNRDLFQIDATSGILSFVRQLDYENNHEHTITIDATNPNPPCASMNTAYTSVFIQVGDLNDTPPQFEHTLYNVSIPERDYSSEPQDIITVTCTDPDTTKHLTYSIPDSDIFEIDNGGVVNVMGLVDYEASVWILVEVYCRDTGRGSVDQIDYAFINVSVIPRNEHRPVILPSTLAFSIGDITAVGTLLVSPVPGSNALKTYAVTDNDRGHDHGEYNFTITSLLPNYTDYFHLDRQSGRLLLKRKFDKTECGQEVKGGAPRENIVMRIIVCDIADTATCEILTVHIFVLTSDCEAYFPSSPSTISVSEFSPVGTNILYLPCLDHSDTTNKTVTIVPNQSDSTDILHTFFYANGHIVLRQTIDYEKIESYSFKLFCENSYSTNASVRIVVNVLPENDNAPVFYKSVYLVVEFRVVSESTGELPQNVTEVLARDEDNDNLTYSLVGPSDYFTVGSSDGRVLQSQIIPKSEDDAVFELTVGVSDGMFSANTTIIIIISEETCSESQPQKKDDNIILILVFSVVLLLMVIILLLSWIFICFLLCRQGRRKHRYSVHTINGARTTTRDLGQNLVHYDMPVVNQPGRAMECLAFDGASFTNDPAFSGSRSGYHNRAKDPLPMEPEYETLPSKEEMSQKEKRTAEPYSVARSQSHVKAEPRNSTDCYVSMQSPAENNNSSTYHQSSLENGGGGGGGGNEGGGFTVGSVPNEYVQICPQVEITNNSGVSTNNSSSNNVGKDFESSLEFGGAIETSLEFGAVRGTSLDFAAAPSKLCRRSRSVSPRVDVVEEEGGVVGLKSREVGENILT